MLYYVYVNCVLGYEHICQVNMLHVLSCTFLHKNNIYTKPESQYTIEQQRNGFYSEALRPPGAQNKNRLPRFLSGVAFFHGSGAAGRENP